MTGLWLTRVDDEGLDGRSPCLRGSTRGGGEAPRRPWPVLAWRERWREREQTAARFEDTGQGFSAGLSRVLSGEESSTKRGGGQDGADDVRGQFGER